MDVLDDILDTLDLKGVLYFRTDFSPPWAVTVPDLDRAARFHLVLQGSCHVAFPSGACVDLAPGDLVLVPRGLSHVLAYNRLDEPDAAPSLETVLHDAGYDGNGVFVVGDGDANAATRMVCGHFTFREGADHPILRALPEYLLTTAAARAREPWLDEMLRLMARCVFSEEIGSRSAVTRLSEIVFIELMRVGISDCSALAGILDAFRDRHVGRALELIHRRPEAPWTVEGLAAEVGMSRSRFAERFRSLMGIGPMAYLSDWRLQKALSLLEDRQTSVQQVATRTGYQSPAAFTRAFVGRFGRSPREHRRVSGFADRTNVVADAPNLTGGD